MICSLANCEQCQRQHCVSKLSIMDYSFISTSYQERQHKAENVPLPIIYLRDVLLGRLRALEQMFFLLSFGRSMALPISSQRGNLSWCSARVPLPRVASPSF